MKNRRRIFALLLALVLCLPACGGAAEETTAEATAAPETQGAAESEEVQEIAGIEAETLTEPIEIAVLKGPTGMGMAYLFGHEEEGYRLSLFEAPDQVTAKLLSGEIDVAAVPSNLGAVLYNKTEGGLVCLAINTGGTLYLVSNAEEAPQSLSELSGQTILASGQGGTPEYVLRALLASAGLAEGDVTIEWLDSHTDVVSRLLVDENALALLPEPHVTIAAGKSEAVRAVLDLGALWQETEGCPLPMGILVTTKAFAEAHAADLEKLLSACAASAEAVNADPAAAAQQIAACEIVASPAVAEAAIPRCSILFDRDPASMEKTLAAFYRVLYDYNAQSVGGALPAPDFYGLQ